MRKSFLFMLIIATVIIIVSCSKDSSGDSSSKVLVSSACSLLSVDEATAITSLTYTNTESTENTAIGQKLCVYTTSAHLLFQISLIETANIPVTAGLKTAKAFYESMEIAFPDHEDISGVGDKAFLDNTNGFLYILYTNYYMCITLTKSGATTPQKRTMKIDAGKKAIINLKAIITKWIAAACIISPFYPWAKYLSII